MFETLESRRIYEGRTISLRVDTLAIDGGETVPREVVEHKGAVVIVALDSKGNVLLVRQYRHPTGERLLELPAGTLEHGEEPMATAIRELQEETGFFPETIVPAGSFYTAPGFCTELMHLFFARDLRPQSLPADIDEDIELVPTGLGRAKELVLSGEIKDAKSIVGILRYLLTL